MKYRIFLSIIFNILFIQAENKPSMDACELFEQTDDKIFAGAKLTLEDEYSDKLPTTGQTLQLVKYSPEPNSSMIEIMGKYLTTQTDKELQKKIQKNCINTGTILLEDFFNTSSYKQLQKKLEKAICAMTSCNFLTSEESKILGKSKGFYPNDYEKHSYKWDSLKKQNKIKALEGTLHKIIGLKGNKAFAKFDSYIVIINIKYQCSMREIITSNIYREPQHNMTITLEFFRYNNGFGKTVAFTFYISGGARYFSPQNTNSNNQCNIDTSNKFDIKKPLTTEKLNATYLSGSGVTDSLDSQVSQISDFIIKTKFLPTESTKPNA